MLSDTVNMPELSEQGSEWTLTLRGRDGNTVGLGCRTLRLAPRDGKLAGGGFHKFYLGDI